VNNAPTHKCSVCGSELILMSRVTEQIEGSRFFQTNSIFRCSNDECQAEKDKQTEKRLKLRKDKELADKERLEKKVLQRESLKKALDKTTT
jgi:hypothetical protein